jgi:hypothetical protein
MKPLRGPITMRRLLEIGDEKAHKLTQLQILWGNMWRVGGHPIRMERSSRLAIWSKIIGRPLESGKDLTYAEVHTMVKLLEGQGDLSKNFMVWVSTLTLEQGVLIDRTY